MRLCFPPSSLKIKDKCKPLSCRRVIGTQLHNAIQVTLGLFDSSQCSTNFCCGKQSRDGLVLCRMASFRVCVCNYAEVLECPFVVARSHRSIASDNPSGDQTWFQFKSRVAKLFGFIETLCRNCRLRSFK